MGNFHILGIIAILGVLIVVHELGHFLVAKQLGVSVRQFAVGFGPSLWKKTWGETDCRLNLIPLGGYCAFLDDEEGVRDREDPRYLANRTVGERAAVISGGVIFNAIFAWIVLLVMFVCLGIPNGVKVERVLAGTPAAMAQLKPGDTISAVNGKPLVWTGALQYEARRHKSEPVSLTIERNGNTFQQTVTPSEKGMIGVSFLADSGRRALTNPFEPVIYASQTFAYFSEMMVVALGDLFSGKMPLTELGGPVMVVHMGSQVSQADIKRLFDFTALISIELAILNILPLPALDGGHLLLLLVEKLRGRPLPRRVEENVHQVGLMLLIGLGILLIFKDVLTLSVGG